MKYIYVGGSHKSDIQKYGYFLMSGAPRWSTQKFILYIFYEPKYEQVKRKTERQRARPAAGTVLTTKLNFSVKRQRALQIRIHHSKWSIRDVVPYKVWVNAELNTNKYCRHQEPSSVIFHLIWVLISICFVSNGFTVREAIWRWTMIYANRLMG